MCPGIGIGIGVPFGKPIDWAAYWAHSGLFLFFGQYKNIAGGRLNNEVTGSTDWFTVAGIAGSETYQCPNTAPYIAADINVVGTSDYIWFKTDASQRTTTTAELIGYDFTRTLVNYDDTAPYAINWIAILNVGVAVTDAMRDSFHLSIWWDNILNSHGYVKGNRGVGQSIWTAESVEEAETIALVALFTNPPTVARRANIDNLIKYYKGANPTATNVWAKLDVFVNLRAADSQAATRNWTHNDHHGTLIGSPTFTADVGVATATNKYIKTDYIPSIDGVNYIQDSASIGLKIDGYNPALAGVRVLMGCNAGTNKDVILATASAIAGLNRINTGSTTTSGQLLVNGTNIESRTASTVAYNYLNGTPIAHINTAASTVADKELYVGCSNANGVASYFVDGTFEYYLTASGLTAADELVIRTGYAAYIVGL